MCKAHAQVFGTLGSRLYCVWQSVLHETMRVRCSGFDLLLAGVLVLRCELHVCSVSILCSTMFVVYLHVSTSLKPGTSVLQEVGKVILLGRVRVRTAEHI
jgi:hypothetical protein